MKKVILAFFFLILVVIANSMVKQSSPSVFNLLQKSSTVTIDNVTFNVLVSKTQEDREKGLSGRDFLPQDEGMIFLFDKPDYFSFWMKGMKFPLDMIFINNSKIVAIFRNVPIQNPTDTENPHLIADKVLEINAGISKKNNFKVGDFVKISL